MDVSTGITKPSERSKT